MFSQLLCYVVLKCFLLSVFLTGRYLGQRPSLLSASHLLEQRAGDTRGWQSRFSHKTPCILLFSPVRQIRTCRHCQILDLIPRVPLWFHSQFGAEEREWASIFGNPPRVADPIKLWLLPWHQPTCTRKGYLIRTELQIFGKFSLIHQKLSTKTTLLLSSFIFLAEFIMLKS